MKLIVIQHELFEFPDHFERVQCVCEVKPGETVEELAKRLLTHGSNQPNFSGYLELRRVHEATDLPTVPK